MHCGEVFALMCCPPTLSVKKGSSLTQQRLSRTKTVETLQNGSPLALQLQLLYLDRPIKYMDVEEGKGIRRDGALSPRHSVRQRLLSNSNTEGSGTQGQ